MPQRRGALIVLDRRARHSRTQPGIGRGRVLHGCFSRDGDARDAARCSTRGICCVEKRLQSLFGRTGVHVRRCMADRPHRLDASAGPGRVGQPDVHRSVGSADLDTQAQAIDRACVRGSSASHRRGPRPTGTTRVVGSLSGGRRLPRRDPGDSDKTVSFATASGAGAAPRVDAFLLPPLRPHRPWISLRTLARVLSFTELRTV